MRKFVALFFTLFLCVTACAATPKVTYYILEDASLKLTADNALVQFEQSKFTLQRTKEFNPGFTKSVYWLAVEIDSNENADSLRLVIGQPVINQIDFYSVDNSAKLMHQTGDLFPYSHRPMPTVDFSFPLSNKSHLYLLRIDKHNESLQLNYDTLDITNFISEETNISLITGLLTGIIVLLLVFGLYLTFITRKRVYIFYLLYIFSGWMWVLADQGFGFKYLWPDSTWLASRSRPLFCTLTIALSLQYVIYYLGGLKTNILEKLLLIISWISLLFTALLLIPIDVYNANIVSWVMLISVPAIVVAYVVLSLLALIIEASRKNVMALFYLGALIPLMLLTIVNVLNHTALINFSSLSLQRYGVAVGYVCEAIILTFGLVYQFNSYRVQKEKLQLDFEIHQKENAKALIETEATERKRIADELHDIAGSMLSAAKLNITSLREKNLIPGAEAKLKLEKAEEAIESVAGSVRNLSHALSPIMIDKIGFKKAIENITTFFNSSGKIDIEVEIIGFEQYQASLDNIYSAVYSIIYELVNNIVKHANASHALIQLIEHDNCITLIIEDNGKGLSSEYDKQNTKGHNGVISKINYFNGSIMLENTSQGLIISIEIPKALYEKKNSSGG